MMKLSEYSEALEARAKLMRESKADAPIVINRWEGQTERQEWAAWVKYWTAIKAHGTLELAVTRTMWTVPTLYPWEFDIGYNG